MITYPVGWNRTYKTIQAAIDAIEAAVAGSPSEEHEIRIYDSRLYAGFSLPFMGFHPAIPLWIRADTGAKPVVSGLVDKLNSWIGIKIGNGVDLGFAGLFVEDLTVQGFEQGVVADLILNCFFRRCRFIDNRMYGVRLYRGGETAFQDCVFQGSRVLLAGIQTSGLILVHNFFDTVDPNGNCVWLDWQADKILTYSAQEMVSFGVKWIRSTNNVFVSRGRPCIALQKDMEGGIKADGNVYWSDVGAIADVYEYVDGSKTSFFVSDMYDWRRRTGGEEASAFTDPQLIQIPTSQRSQEDGALLPTSPAISVGVAVDTSESTEQLSFYRGWYQPYDAAGTARVGVSNAGTVEYPTHQDYDYLGFLDLTSDFPMTDPDTLYGADRAVAQLDESVEPWYPRVKAGHFFVRDNAYYLFAEKRTEYLSAFRWRVVELSTDVEVDSVYIDDTPVQWMWRGKKVWACEDGVVLTAASVIRVHGKQRDWNTSDNGFDEANVSYEFSLYEQAVEHYFPSDPVDGAPVVITDDSIHPNAPRTLLPFEYSIAYDDAMRRYRLKLQGEENRLRGSHFDEDLGWAPFPAWADTQVDTSDVPFAGRNVLHFERGTPAATSEYTWQDAFRYDDDSDMVFSFHYRKNSVGDHQITVETFLEDGTPYSSTSFPFVPEYDGSRDWARYVIFLKAGEDSVLLDHGADYDVLLGTVPLWTVDGKTTPKVRFRLEAASPATSDVSGLMAFEGSYVPRYAGLPEPDRVTVEYETSRKQLHRADLSIAPLVNPNANGFFTVGPLPATIFDPIASVGATTLNDQWAPLRFGTLPWAKLDGPGKLSRTPQKAFRLRGVGLPWEVGEQPSVAFLDRLAARPDPVVVRQGGEVPVVISAMDEAGNPWIYRTIVATLDAGDTYPGLLGLRELSSPSIMDTSVDAVTDTAGKVVLSVIAPSQEEVRVAVALADVDTLIETPYPVNLERNGNIVIRDATTLEPLDILGPSTSESLLPDALGAYAFDDLAGRPAFGTVRVMVDGDGVLDMELRESRNAAHQPGTFYMNYETRILSVPAEFTRALVTYLPLLAWPATGGVAVNSGLVASITSDIVVDYDAKATLHFSSPGLSSDIDVVYQNPEIP